MTPAWLTALGLTAVALGVWALAGVAARLPRLLRKGREWDHWRHAYLEWRIRQLEKEREK